MERHRHRHRRVIEESVRAIRNLVNAGTSLQQRSAPLRSREPIACDTCTFINEGSSLAAGRCSICETPFPPRALGRGPAAGTSTESSSDSYRIEVVEHQHRINIADWGRLIAEEERNLRALVALRRRVNRQYFSARVEGRDPDWVVPAVDSRDILSRDDPYDAGSSQAARDFELREIERELERERERERQREMPTRR
jgi:hypothetical protein